MSWLFLTHMGGETPLFLPTALHWGWIWRNCSQLLRLGASHVGKLRRAQPCAMRGWIPGCAHISSRSRGTKLSDTEINTSGHEIILLLTNLSSIWSIYKYLLHVNLGSLFKKMAALSRKGLINAKKQLETRKNYKQHWTTTWRNTPFV